MSRKNLLAALLLGLGLVAVVSVQAQEGYPQQQQRQLQQRPFNLGDKLRQLFAPSPSPNNQRYSGPSRYNPHPRTTSSAAKQARRSSGSSSQNSSRYQSSRSSGRSQGYDNGNSSTARRDSNSPSRSGYSPRTGSGYSQSKEQMREDDRQPLEPRPVRSAIRRDDRPEVAGTDIRDETEEDAEEQESVSSRRRNSDVKRETPQEVQDANPFRSSRSKEETADSEEPSEPTSVDEKRIEPTPIGSAANEPEVVEHSLEPEPSVSQQSSPRNQSSRGQSSRTRSFEEPTVEPPAATEPAGANTPVELDTPVVSTGSLTPGALFTQKSAALTVQTLGPRKLVLGQEAKYTLVLRNTSEVAAEDVAVMVQVPSLADVIETEATSGTARTPVAKAAGEGILWNIARLGARSREELVITLVPRSSGSLELGVQWTSAPSSTQVSVDIREPKLELTVGGPEKVAYGEKAIYELTFNNPGTADAENVMVRLLPIEPGDAADSHRIGTIAAGTKKVVEVELVARQSGQINIRAEATADGGLRSPVLYQVEVLRADIRIDVEGPQFRYSGSVATYKVRVTNPGNAAAKNVEVGAVLPHKAELLSCSDGGAEEEGGRLRWKLASLAAGGEQVFLVKCEMKHPGANRVQVVAAADGELRDNNSTTTDVEALADLDLEVIDPKGPVPVGEDVEYEVIIRNRGTKAASNVELAVTLAADMEPIDVQGARHSTTQGGQLLIEPLASLAAGEERKLKITARALVGGNHTFRVDLECKSLDSRLAQQETTRFYGDERVRTTQRTPVQQPTPVNEPSDRPFSSRRRALGEQQDPKPLEPTPLEPTPAYGQPTSLEPTPLDSE